MDKPVSFFYSWPTGIAKIPGQFVTSVLCTLPNGKWMFKVHLACVASTAPSLMQLWEKHTSRNGLVIYIHLYSPQLPSKDHLS